MPCRNVEAVEAQEGHEGKEIRVMRGVDMAFVRGQIESGMFPRERKAAGKCCRLRVLVGMENVE